MGVGSGGWGARGGGGEHSYSHQPLYVFPGLVNVKWLRRLKPFGGLNTIFFARKWPEKSLKSRYFPKINASPKEALHFLLGALDTAYF